MENQRPYPLERLFHVLRREAGFPLGVDDFLALQMALVNGFGLETLAELRNLCHLLWAKSKAQSQKLDHHFDQIVVTQADAVLEKKVDTFESIALPEIEGFPAIRSLTEQFENALRIEAMQQQKRIQSRVIQVQEEREKLHQQLLKPETPGKFLLEIKYSNLNERQLGQAWRKLRVQERFGPKNEIDFEATVRSVAKRGAFYAAEMQAGLENVAKLHFLVDREGSMVPFHHFSSTILEAAKSLGNISSATQHYFHDIPAQLFRQELLIEPIASDVFLQSLEENRSLLVIVSDAGAARGSFDTKRIETTKALLEDLRRRSRNVVWLNPMPSKRWEGSSAGEIAAVVPMFECTNAGLLQAVDALRGHTLTRKVYAR